MPYIDADYYQNVYAGIAPDDPETLNRLIIRASRDIDSLTRFTIIGFEDLHANVQSNIKMATAAQVEYLIEYGETASTIQSGGGFRIGAYSEDGNGTSEGQGVSTAISVEEYLLPTGYLYRGVDVRG